RELQILERDGQFNNLSATYRVVGADLLPGAGRRFLREQKLSLPCCHERKRQLIGPFRRLQLQFDRRPCLLYLQLLVGIEAEIEMFKVPAEPNIGQDSLGFPHCAEWRPSRNSPCSAPLEKISHKSID